MGAPHCTMSPSTCQLITNPRKSRYHWATNYRLRPPSCEICLYLFETNISYDFTWYPIYIPFYPVIYIYITYPITYHKFLPYIPLSNYNPLYNYIPSQYIPTISPVYPDHILVIPICTYPYYILIISLFYIITYIPLYPHNPLNDPKYA